MAVASFCSVFAVLPFPPSLLSVVTTTPAALRRRQAVLGPFTPSPVNHTFIHSRSS
jgi:hypothetical protein